MSWRCTVARDRGIATIDQSYTTITEDQCRDIQLASLATTAPAIATAAAQMKWVRIHNRTGTPLWTSDRPVTRYNPKPATLMGNLGWACPGIQVFFPLSPTLALCICDPDEYGARPSEMQIEDVKQITLQNHLQLRHATRFVFSRSGDFDLATEVLDANPEIGDPVRERTSWREPLSERRDSKTRTQALRSADARAVAGPEEDARIGPKTSK